MVKAAIKKLILKCLNIILKDLDIKRTFKSELSNAILDSENLKHVPPPYNLSDKSLNKSELEINECSKGQDAVIITGRFRSGTTLFWNMFRNAEGYHSFYEPFNERQWFDPKKRGNNVDRTHRGVSDYWAEYAGFEQLKQHYNEDWIHTNLLMTKKTWAPDMFNFVEYLINNSKGRPVLQFNRIDFRLSWFRHYFPNAKYIHIYRNPRDQFCSFLTDKEKMNSKNVHKTYVDGFYLHSWCDDLSLHYPFLSRKQNLHPYCYFYFIWKLSFIHGTTYADISISYEDLVQYPQESLQKVFTLLKDKRMDAQKLSAIIDKPALDSWKSYAEDSWFYKHEKYCEEILKIYFNI